MYSNLVFFSLALLSLCRYNSLLLWYFRVRSQWQEAYKQSDLIEYTVNPTLAQEFNLASPQTHCRPINPLLNPKAFFILWSMFHPLPQIPLCLSLTPPPPPCACACACVYVWVCVHGDESVFRHSWHHHPVLGHVSEQSTWTRSDRRPACNVQPAGLPWFSHGSAADTGC